MLAQAVLKSSSPESDEHELPKPSLRRQRRVAVPFWQPRGDNAENIAAPPTMRGGRKVDCPSANERINHPRALVISRHGS
jgi:hypothetical protein